MSSTQWDTADKGPNRSSIGKSRSIEMNLDKNAEDKHPKFNVPEESPRQARLGNDPAQQFISGGKHASFGDDLPSYRQSQERRPSSGSHARFSEASTSGEHRGLDKRASSSSFHRKSSILGGVSVQTSGMGESEPQTDDIAESLLMDQRARPLCVGDLVMINCSTGSLMGCLVGNDHTGGRFGNMNVKLQASKHHVFDEQGEIIESIIGGNDSSSQCTALMIFEVYRCSSAEDLNRASMNRTSQGYLSKDHINGNITSTPKGTPVLFNQALQLRHYHSRKLLVIDIHAKSATDPLSMEVLLQNEFCQNDDEISKLTHAETISNSWFTIESANTSLDLGEVQMGDDFFLRSDRWKRYLHIFEDEFDDSDSEEEEEDTGNDTTKNATCFSESNDEDNDSLDENVTTRDKSNSSAAASLFKPFFDSQNSEEFEVGGTVNGEEGLGSQEGSEDDMPEESPDLVNETSSSYLFGVSATPGGPDKKPKKRVSMAGPSPRGSDSNKENHRNKYGSRYSQTRRKMRANGLIRTRAKPRLSGSFEKTCFHCVPYRLFNRNELTNPLGSLENSSDGANTSSAYVAPSSQFGVAQHQHQHQHHQHHEYDKHLKSIIEAPDEFPLLRGGDVVFLSHSEDGVIRYWRDTLLRDRSCVVVLPPAGDVVRATEAEASFADAAMTSSSLDMWQIEFSSPVLGGRCVKVGDKILLRHFSSHHYLSLREEDGAVEIVNAADLSHRSYAEQTYHQFTGQANFSPRRDEEEVCRDVREVRESCFFIIHARSSSHGSANASPDDEGWVKLSDLLLLQHATTGRWLSTGPFNWTEHDTIPIIKGSTSYDGRERRQLLGDVGRDAGIWSRSRNHKGVDNIAGFPSTRDFFTIYRVLPYDLELVHDVAGCRDLLMRRTRELFKSLQQATCYLDALSKPGCLDGLLGGVLHLVELLEHSEGNRVAPDRNLTRRGWIQRLYLETGVMDAAFCAVAALFDEPPKNITKERLQSILQQLKKNKNHSSGDGLMGGALGVTASTKFEVSCPLSVIDRLRLAPGMVLLPHKPKNRVTSFTRNRSSSGSRKERSSSGGSSAMKGLSEEKVLKMLCPGCRIVEVDGMLSTTAFEASGRDDTTSPTSKSSTGAKAASHRKSIDKSTGREWVKGGEVEQGFLAKAAVSASLKGRATLRLVVSRALCDEMLHVSAVSYNDPAGTGKSAAPAASTTAGTSPNPTPPTKVMRRTSLNMTMGAAFSDSSASAQEKSGNTSTPPAEHANSTNSGSPRSTGNDQNNSGLSPDVSSRIDAVRTLLMAVLRLASGFVQGGAEFQRHLRPYISFVSRFQGYKVNASSLLAAMYRNNVDLIKDTREPHIRNVLRLIERRGFQPKFIEFLKNLCTLNHQVEIGKQLLVAKIFLTEFSHLIPRHQIVQEGRREKYVVTFRRYPRKLSRKHTADLSKMGKDSFKAAQTALHMEEEEEGSGEEECKRSSEANVGPERGDEVMDFTLSEFDRYNSSTVLGGLDVGNGIGAVGGTADMVDEWSFGYLAATYDLVATLCRERCTENQRRVEAALGEDIVGAERLLEFASSKCVPHAMRAVYLNLFRCLHVDRDPIHPAPTINHVRVWDFRGMKQEKTVKSASDESMIQHTKSLNKSTKISFHSDEKGDLRGSVSDGMEMEGIFSSVPSHSKEDAITNVEMIDLGTRFNPMVPGERLSNTGAAADRSENYGGSLDAGPSSLSGKEAADLTKRGSLQHEMKMQQARLSKIKRTSSKQDVDKDGQATASGDDLVRPPSEDRDLGDKPEVVQTSDSVETLDDSEEESPMRYGVKKGISYATTHISENDAKAAETFHFTVLRSLRSIVFAQLSEVSRKIMKTQIPKQTAKFHALLGEDASPTMSPRGPRRSQSNSSFSSIAALSPKISTREPIRPTGSAGGQGGLSPGAGATGMGELSPSRVEHQTKLHGPLARLKEISPAVDFLDLLYELVSTAQTLLRYNFIIFVPDKPLFRNDDEEGESISDLLDFAVDILNQLIILPSKLIDPWDMDEEIAVLHARCNRTKTAILELIGLIIEFQFERAVAHTVDALGQAARSLQKKKKSWFPFSSSKKKSNEAEFADAQTILERVSLVNFTDAAREVAKAGDEVELLNMSRDTWTNSSILATRGNHNEDIPSSSLGSTKQRQDWHDLLFPPTVPLKGSKVTSTSSLPIAAFSNNLKHKKLTPAQIIELQELQRAKDKNNPLLQAIMVLTQEEDRNLANRAFTLLFRLHRQGAELATHLEKVDLISAEDDGTVKVLQNMVITVTRLRRTAKLTAKRASDVSILEELTEVRDKLEGPLGMIAERMLGSLGALPIFLTILSGINKDERSSSSRAIGAGSIAQASASSSKGKGPNTPTSASMHTAPASSTTSAALIAHVVVVERERQLILEILLLLLELNRDSHAPFMLKHLDILIDCLPGAAELAADLIIDLIADEVSASGYIHESQVRRLLGFVDLSEYSGESSIELSESALKVLYMSVICNDIAVTKNQNLVLSILLKDSVTIGRITEFVVTVAQSGSEKLQREKQEEKNKPQDSEGKRSSFLTNWYEDGLKDVFARVFDLLAGCCFGRNHYAETQARSLLSASDLLKLLGDAQAYAQWTLANSVQNFLNMAFLDVTVQSDRFGQSPAAWELLRLNCQVLQVISTAELHKGGSTNNLKATRVSDMPPGSHLSAFDPAEDFFLYHYIHGAVLPSTEELFLHYITEIDANSSRIAFRHNSFDLNDAFSKGSTALSRQSSSGSSQSSSMGDMSPHGGARVLDVAQGDTSRRKQCVDLLTALYTLHKCKRHWRAAGKSTWQDVDKAAAEAMLSGVSSGSGHRYSQNRSHQRNSERVLRQLNRKGSARYSKEPNPQQRTRMSLEEDEASERHSKYRKGGASSDFSQTSLWSRQDILMHQGRSLHVMHMILNASAIAPELYPLLDGLSAYLFRNSHLFSWYLTRLHDLEEAKKNYGSPELANAKVKRGSKTVMNDRDSDSLDLEGDDLTDIDVDIEFTPGVDDVDSPPAQASLIRNTSFFTRGFGSANPPPRSGTISDTHPEEPELRKRSSSTTLVVEGVGELDVLQPATLLDSEAVRQLIFVMKDTDHTAGLVELLRHSGSYTDCLEAMIKQLDPSRVDGSVSSFNSNLIGLSDSSGSQDQLTLWGKDPTLIVSVNILTEIIRGCQTLDERYESQLRLNHLGAGLVVIKLIGRSASIPRGLLFATLGLAIAMLKGGNHQVQEEVSMYLLNSTLDEAFFAGVSALFRQSADSMNVEQQQRHVSDTPNNLDNLMSSNSVSSTHISNGLPRTQARSRSSSSSLFSSATKSQRGSIREGKTTANINKREVAKVDSSLMIRLVEVLRLLCEDHYTPIQDYFRRQPDNLRSYNLVGEVVAYMSALQWVLNPRVNLPQWNIDAQNSGLCVTLLRCLSEFAQGNIENQKYLAQERNLMLCLNDFLTHDLAERGDDEDDEDDEEDMPDSPTNHRRQYRARRSSSGSAGGTDVPVVDVNDLKDSAVKARQTELNDGENIVFGSEGRQARVSNTTNPTLEYAPKQSLHRGNTSEKQEGLPPALWRVRRAVVDLIYSILEGNNDPNVALVFLQSLDFKALIAFGNDVEASYQGALDELRGGELFGDYTHAAYPDVRQHSSGNEIGKALFRAGKASVDTVSRMHTTSVGGPSSHEVSSVEEVRGFGEDGYRSSTSSSNLVSTKTNDFDVGGKKPPPLPTMFMDRSEYDYKNASSAQIKRPMTLAESVVAMKNAESLRKQHKIKGYEAARIKKATERRKDLDKAVKEGKTACCTIVMILKRLLDVAELSSTIAAAVAASSGSALRGGGATAAASATTTNFSRSIGGNDQHVWRDATRRLTSSSTGSTRFLNTWSNYVGSVEIVRPTSSGSNSVGSGLSKDKSSSSGNITVASNPNNDTSVSSGNKANNSGNDGSSRSKKERFGIERMYFEIPVPILDTLTNPSFLESRSYFVQHLAKIRDNSDRMQDLHFRGNLLILESMYLTKLRKRSPTLHFLASNEMLWMNLTFALALGINVMDLTNQMTFDSVPNRLVFCLGIIHGFFAALRYVAYATNRYRRILNHRFVQAEEKRRKGRHVTDKKSYNLFDLIYGLYEKIQEKRLKNKLRYQHYYGRHGSGTYYYLNYFCCYLLPTPKHIKNSENDRIVGGLTSSAASRKMKSDNSADEGWKRTEVPFHDPHKNVKISEIVARVFRACAYQNFYGVSTFLAFMFNCWAQIEANRQPFWRYGRMAFYSLCLLDICVRNASLERVLAAVKLNRSQLGQTALLMIVIIYIYTTFIFWSFRDDFVDGSTSSDPISSNEKYTYRRCETIAQCLVTAYDEGLRQDVGLAEYLIGLQTYGERARPVYVIALRLLLDVGWWVAITLLLVNIVAGVIIDAFAELRDTDKRLQSMLDTKCLICGCDASDLNTRGSGYRSHLKDEHNLWNYVWLRLALRTKVEAGISKMKQKKENLHGKRSTEFTGQESYVWAMIEEDDRSYIPQKQAMCFLASNNMQSFEAQSGSVGSSGDIGSSEHHARMRHET